MICWFNILHGRRFVNRFYRFNTDFVEKNPRCGSNFREPAAIQRTKALSIAKKNAFFFISDLPFAETRGKMLRGNC